MQYYSKNGGPPNHHVDNRQPYIQVPYSVTDGTNGYLTSSLSNTSASTSSSSQGYVDQRFIRPTCQYTSTAPSNVSQYNSMYNLTHNTQSDSSCFMQGYSSTSQLSSNYGSNNGTFSNKNWSGQSTFIDLSQPPAQNLDVFNGSHHLLQSRSRLHFMNTDNVFLRDPRDQGCYSGAISKHPQNDLWNLPTSFNVGNTDVSTHSNFPINMQSSHQPILDSNHCQQPSQLSQLTQHQQLMYRNGTQFPIHNVNDCNNNMLQSVSQQDCCNLQHAQQQLYYTEAQHSTSQLVYNSQNPSVKDLTLTQHGARPTVARVERKDNLPAYNFLVNISIHYGNNMLFILIIIN